LGSDLYFSDKSIHRHIIDHFIAIIVFHVGNEFTFAREGEGKDFMFGAMKKIGRIGQIRVQISNVKTLMIKERWDRHGV
jgi:hypothetical protein